MFQLSFKKINPIHILYIKIIPFPQPSCTLDTKTERRRLDKIYIFGIGYVKNVHISKK